MCYRCRASFFFYCSASHRSLHSFPTRRSSDLLHARFEAVPVFLEEGLLPVPESPPLVDPDEIADVRLDLLHVVLRSEEHTSELQSRRDLGCRLMLEKKKKTVIKRKAEMWVWHY